ncbi:MAG: ABC transporter permease [Saccharofermentanales bacterium]|jgi:osmoprotectant transport system permease protein
MTALFQYFSENWRYILIQSRTHFLISAYGVLLACFVAIPLGILLAYKQKDNSLAMIIANILQTIPSIAMLSVLMIFFGLGSNTVIIANFLYSLLPILKNTYVGITNVDKKLLDIAEGLGMTKIQRLFKVVLPLSISIIIGGIKNAIVIAVGITTVGTFVGSGGLGDIITRGINMVEAGEVVWAGALGAAFMAVLLDILLGFLEKKLTPKQQKASSF